MILELKKLSMTQALYCDTIKKEILNEIDSFIKYNDLSDKWKLDWL